MMNAEMAEEKEWMDMESRIRRYIGNDSFRILLTSKANGERFSKCSGILLEGVEGGVLYLLPEPEAERIMKEKDERFCLGVGKEHRSVMEIPEAYQEALLAREMAFIQKNPVEEYQKTINEQISNFAQTYPTNLKASSNEALLFMRRYRFANCSCFSCCFKDAYPSSNVQ